MKLFNSKSNKLEEFIPLIPNKVSLYLCGPTVYDNAHIGNARPIVVFDLLRRVLKAEGYAVHFVSNFTDIDDKIIQKAIEEVTTETDIANKYIEAYEAIRNGLYASGIDAKPRVTAVIDEIIDFIGALIDKEYAYVVAGDVYFRVSKVETYGQISHQKLDELKVGSRIEKNTDKENPLDFVLWKNTDKGIKWQAPWGEGRPGWHTECVVMIHSEFGERIDIHAGGQDLKFPHHENESAQSYAYHDHDLANYWMHNAMLQIDGEKMSKSLGNVILAKDYLEKFGSNVTRWLLLSTHYRLVLNVSDETIKQSQSEVSRLETVLHQGYLKLELLDEFMNDDFKKDVYDAFLDALKDDLNVANAMAVLFEEVKVLNAILRSREIDVKTLKASMHTLEKMIDILGLYIPKLMLSDEDRAMFIKWDALKKSKKYDEADSLRHQLIERGLL